VSQDELDIPQYEAVSGGPTSPWWSTVDEQVFADALSSGNGGAGVMSDDLVPRRQESWSLYGAKSRMDRRQPGRLEPHESEFLAAWKLLNGHRPLGNV